MKMLINKYSDKISFILATFNFSANTFHTKYGTLYSYLFKNLNGIVTISVYIVCYLLAKRIDSIYSKITFGIIYLYLILIIVLPLVMSPFMF